VNSSEPHLLSFSTALGQFPRTVRHFAIGHVGQVILDILGRSKGMFFSSHKSHLVNVKKLIEQTNIACCLISRLLLTNFSMSCCAYTHFCRRDAQNGATHDMAWTSIKPQNGATAANGLTLLKIKMKP